MLLFRFYRKLPGLRVFSDFRHAEATSNKAADGLPKGSAERNAAYDDTRWFDARLSERGEEQCVSTPTMTDNIFQKHAVLTALLDRCIDFSNCDPTNSFRIVQQELLRAVEGLAVDLVLSPLPSEPSAALRKRVAASV